MPDPSKKLSLPEGTRPLLDFGVRVVVATVVFITVLAATAAIGLFIHLLEGTGFSPAWFRDGAGMAERGLFYLDTFSFTLYVVSETITLVKHLWKEHVHD